MTLELVVKQALIDNADCLGNECDCVSLGVAKAVREFLLSDEVVSATASAIVKRSDGCEWSKMSERAKQWEMNVARSALSSITGGE